MVAGAVEDVVTNALSQRLPPQRQSLRRQLLRRLPRYQSQLQSSQRRPWSRLHRRRLQSSLPKHLSWKRKPPRLLSSLSLRRQRAPTTCGRFAASGPRPPACCKMQVSWPPRSWPRMDPEQLRDIVAQGGPRYRMIDPTRGLGGHAGSWHRGSSQHDCAGPALL